MTTTTNNPPIPVAVATRPRSRRRRSITADPAILFALPGLLLYGVFLIYPTLRSFWLSLTSWDGISPHRSFVGLKNYTDMLHDPVVHTALFNNIAWAVVTIVVPMVVGLALATVLTGSIYARPFLRTIFYMPAVLPLVAVGTMWGWLFEPTNGVVDVLLHDIGLGSLAHAWLGDSHTAIWATMVPACWVRTGFPLLLYMAALQGIPKELYESAQTEGAGAWQQFRYITLPQLRSANLIVLALSLIEAIKVFDLVYAMTQGGPGNATQTLGTWMYFNVFQNYHAGYGTAIAVLITLVAVAAGIPYVRSQTKDQT